VSYSDQLSLDFTAGFIDLRNTANDEFQRFRYAFVLAAEFPLASASLARDEFHLFGQ
jgi:hypothetical protein